ncbi:MAG TPA: hypothetical protein VLE74_00530 [Candidatus Saccharimonadales bacterium]|nr:hypothetical protein [Candidatus Saccharimonadales bacterium]
MKYNLVDKLFRDKDYKFAILQVPNVPLCLWAAAALGAHFLPQASWRHASGWVATLALLIWSLLEIYNGASLFRRLVGAGVLLAIILNRI